MIALRKTVFQTWSDRTRQEETLTAGVGWEAKPPTGRKKKCCDVELQMPDWHSHVRLIAKKAIPWGIRFRSRRGGKKPPRREM